MKRAVIAAVGLCLLGCGASGGTYGPKAGNSAAGPAAPAKPSATLASDAAPGDGDEGTEVRADQPWIGAGTPSSFVFASSSEQKAAVWVDVPKGIASGHVPTALTLVIDTSGSMSGEKIEHARSAARALVDELSDGDSVTLVTFSDMAQLRVSPTAIDSHSRRRIHQTIDALRANGGTNLFDALNHSASFARHADPDHPVRRTVLISDGKATVGPSDPASFGRLAEVGFQNGVQITAIGVGLDYDEHTLNTLAMRSSGRLHHLESSAGLARLIREEMDLIDSTAATNATLEIVAAPGVRLRGADGATSAWQQPSRVLRVPLGTLFGGQTREVAVRFSLDRPDEGRRALISARLVYSDPQNGGVERVQEALVHSTITRDEQLLETAENARARHIVASVQAAQFATLASASLNAGDFAAADEKLARAEKELRQSVAVAKSKSDKKRAMRDMQRVQEVRRSVAKSANAPAAAKPKASRARALDANEAAMKLQGF